ncbi:P2Y purinoceptor 8-like [Arapaima gigas]
MVVVYGYTALSISSADFITPGMSSLDNITLAMFKDNVASSIVSTVYILVALINFPVNGLCIWLLLFRTFPKTATVVFMITLTLTDLVIGCVLPFQIVYLVRGYNWPFGSTMCNFTTVLFYANMYCSILTMTAISTAHYIGIVQPMEFKNITRNKLGAVIICAIMWIIILAVLYPLESTDLTYQVSSLNITTCFDILQWDMLPTQIHWLIYLVIWCGVLFLIPFIITVFCYIRIMQTLARSSSDSKERALWLAFLVLFIFIVCFAPNNILLVAHGLRRLVFKDSLYMAYKLSLLLSCINSCLDPFIYYFASKEFRQNLWEVLDLQPSTSCSASFQKLSFFSNHSLSERYTDNKDHLFSAVNNLVATEVV